jgi:transposase
VLTVGNDAARVERMLEEGSLGCPVCGGRLSRWGYGRERVVFGPGRKGRAVRPRRSRCVGCGVTHVLLPARLLLRRVDEAVVIGAALAAAARWRGLLTVSPWEIASAVTNATLMAPVMAARAFNASSLS